MKLKEISEGNRKAFNEAMPFHKKAKGEFFRKNFAKKDFIKLDNDEISKLKEIGINKKTVAHLCCNNGVELISIVRLGASKGYGFDIADEAIKDAKELCKIADANCEFIQSDIYEIESKYYGIFDVVYISAGSLNWLPELDKFYKIVSLLLKKGGVLFIYEIHPFTEIFASDDNPKFDPSNIYKIVHSYFDNAAQVQDNGIDYLGKEKYKSAPTYWFSHTISESINNCIKSGLSIKEFTELPSDVSAVLGHFENDKMIPLSFILIAKKD